MAMNSVQSYLDELIKRIPKLYGILVTDKDGVTLVRGTSETLSELHFDPALSASFTSAAEQSVNLLPLVLSVLAAPDVNVQLIQNSIPEMARVLEPVRQSVQQTVMQAAREEQ